MEPGPIRYRQPARAPQGPVQLRVPATLEPFEIVTVSSRVAGMVESIHFMDGDNVKAGASLASIDYQRYLLEEKSARADELQARAVHSEAQQALERREQIERNQSGVLSLEEMSAARTRAAQSAANLAKAEANRASRAMITQWSRVPAPRSGTLQRRLVSTGQYVQPGTPIVTLVQRDPLLLHFEVNSDVAVRIDRGIHVHARTAEGRQLDAQVIFVGDTALPGTRQIPVTARITNPARDLRDIRGGESADVSLALRLPDPSVLIPDTAVRPTDKGYRTYVVQGDEAKPRPIQIGARLDDGHIEIVSGLTAGEIVVTRGAEALKDGARIRLVGAPDRDTAPTESTAPPSDAR